MPGKYFYVIIIISVLKRVCVQFKIILFQENGKADFFDAVRRVGAVKSRKTATYMVNPEMTEFSEKEKEQ